MICLGWQWIALNRPYVLRTMLLNQMVEIALDFVPPGVAKINFHVRRQPQLQAASQLLPLVVLM